MTIKATLKQRNTVSRLRLVRNLKHQTPVFSEFLLCGEPGNHVDVNYIGVGAEADPSSFHQLLSEYEDVLPKHLPAGLPRERSRAFHIELEEGAKPHRRGMYRLSES